MDINTIPTNDLVLHIENEHCPCKPRIEYHEGGRLIIHNSIDGREDFEDIEGEEQ